MKHVRVRGFKIFKDRHGKWRCYHRATGMAVDLEKHPLGTAGFFGECSRIAALEAKGAEPKPGTLGMLIAKYRSHMAFTELAPRTQKDYQRIFDYLKPIADTPLPMFSPPLVVKIRDKAVNDLGRKWANYTKAVLSVIFAWGVERGYLSGNPAENIKNIRRPKDAPDANRPWSDAERKVVVEALPRQLRLPIILMMYCGIDPQDALTLPRTAIRDGKLDIRRSKTKVPLWLPLPGPVLDALREAPAHNAPTVCASSRGTTWTDGGFRSSWGKFKGRLERKGLIQPGLTPKGLRHTVATILAERGYDDRTIADYLAQKTTAMARHYSRRADKSRKLAAVSKDFETDMRERDAEVVKPT